MSSKNLREVQKPEQLRTVQPSGFRVSGFGFRVQGSGLGARGAWAYDLGCRVECRLEGKCSVLGLGLWGFFLCVLVCRGGFWGLGFRASGWALFGLFGVQSFGGRTS